LRELICFLLIDKRVFFASALSKAVGAIVLWPAGCGTVVACGHHSAAVRVVAAAAEVVVDDEEVAG